MHHELPDQLDLDWYRKQAKDLVRAWRDGDPATKERVEEALGERAQERFGLSDAQWVIAREHGYRSWADFARWVRTREPEQPVGRIGLQPVAAYEERARGLMAALGSGDGDALRRVRTHVPSLSEFSGGALALRDAKLVVAREYGFPTWRDLVYYVNKDIREHEGQREGSPEVVAALAAIRADDLDTLGELLDRHRELAGPVHGGAWNTLLEAIAQPDAVGENLGIELGVAPRIVKVLIERSSELDGPLNLAACFNRAELVRMLLDAHADRAASGPWGTALQTAIYHGSAEAADLLSTGELAPDTLYSAAATGRLDQLEKWFDATGKLRPEAFASRPNLADVGWPPAPPPRDDPQEVIDEAFALAAYSGRIESMERLLELGASPDGTAHGLTGLHFAIIRGRLDVVRWLLDHGADLAVRDGIHRRTPVGWGGGEAQRGGDERIAIRELLVERSAGVTGDLGLAFERAWATWGERGEAVLDSGLTYDGERPILVLANKREGRYSFSDQGAAIEAAGRPPGWREVADDLAERHVVNISKSGVVWLPATNRRAWPWLPTLPGRIANASAAFYGALLELEE